jgi:hypothetical protein
MTGGAKDYQIHSVGRCRSKVGQTAHGGAQFLFMSGRRVYADPDRSSRNVHVDDATMTGERRRSLNGNRAIAAVLVINLCNRGAG